MWYQIVSVPDLCLSFYFSLTIPMKFRFDLHSGFGAEEF